MSQPSTPSTTDLAATGGILAFLEARLADDERVARRTEADGLTPVERTLGAVRIKGADLRLGDVLVFLDNCHRIDRIAPYRGVRVDNGVLLADTRVAYAGGGFEMTIPSDGEVRVLPRPVLAPGSPEGRLPT